MFDFLRKEYNIENNLITKLKDYILKEISKYDKYKRTKDHEKLSRNKKLINSDKKDTKIIMTTSKPKIKINLKKRIPSLSPLNTTLSSKNGSNRISFLKKNDKKIFRENLKNSFDLRKNKIELKSSQSPQNQKENSFGKVFNINKVNRTSKLFSFLKNNINKYKNCLNTKINHTTKLANAFNTENQEDILKKVQLNLDENCKSLFKFSYDKYYENTDTNRDTG